MGIFNMSANEGGMLAKRRAIEALRNGVPNSDAVRQLGCKQQAIEDRFRETLAGIGESGHEHGMLVSGDFGVGKSHLLAYLEHIALEQGFVCSRVAVSKETPLFDLNKILTAAVDGAKVPGRTGRLIEELELAEKRKTEAFGDFFGWVARSAYQGSLHGIFQASLVAYIESRDPELKSSIEAFWAGDRILASRIKAGLREIGKREYTGFRTPRVAEIPPQRLRFLVEMIRGAGYPGWVVLLDEIELVASYAILQRGRSYAELARWLRIADNPGLVTVATVTPDFATRVISTHGKQDCDNVPPRLRARPRLESIADSAVEGMDQLTSQCMPLQTPNDGEVHTAIETLRKLYSEAYGWDAPDHRPMAGGVSAQNRMRYKVRAAINEWDLKRLFPDSRPEIQSDEYQVSYEEQPDHDPEAQAGDWADDTPAVFRSPGASDG